jgi:anti-sigma B factor antagonist
MPNFGYYFVVCRGVRHAPPDLLPNSLIPRAAGMDSGLPWFTAVFPMFTAVRRTPTLVQRTSQAPGRRGAGQVDCLMRTLLFRRKTSDAGAHNTALEAGEIAIHVVRSSPQSIITVTGRVTVNSSPYLRSVLLDLLRQGAEPLVVIDLSGVSYLDMSGLATLLEALKAARQRSATLRVLGMTGQSRMLAEIAELDKIFRSAGSEVEFG